MYMSPDTFINFKYACGVSLAIGASIILLRNCATNLYALALTVVLASAVLFWSNWVAVVLMLAASALFAVKFHLKRRKR